MLQTIYGTGLFIHVVILGLFFIGCIVHSIVTATYNYIFEPERKKYNAFIRIAHCFRKEVYRRHVDFTFFVIFFGGVISSVLWPVVLPSLILYGFARIARFAVRANKRLKALEKENEK
jgi:hypothetical protein